MSELVSYRKDDAVAVITMDDGKVNVLGPAMLQAINDAIGIRVIPAAESTTLIFGFEAVNRGSQACSNSTPIVR